MEIYFLVVFTLMAFGKLWHAYLMWQDRRERRNPAPPCGKDPRRAQEAADAILEEGNQPARPAPRAATTSKSKHKDADASRAVRPSQAPTPRTPRGGSVAPPLAADDQEEQTRVW